MRLIKYLGRVNKGGPNNIYTIYITSNIVRYKPKYKTRKIKLLLELQEFKDLFNKELASSLLPY